MTTTSESVGPSGICRPSSSELLMPLLLTAHQAAAMCGKATRTFRTWDAAGLIPQPIRIGRSTLWRAEELRAWVAAGCPKRRDWETTQS